jgi:hypothetical integral membrane protein (TIGR02206 family)
MERFDPYGTSHIALLVVAVVGCAAFVVLGRRLRRTPSEVVACRAFAVVLPAVLVPLQVIDFLPGRFDIDTTLPLQLCDLSWVAATLALWNRQPVAVALTYFWGLSLTTQALLTPDLATDFPDPKFLGFAALHLLVVWAAVFLTFGLGLGPRWRDLGTTLAATAAWLVAVFAVNGVLGTNYGFVNGKPEGGSVLDLLPSWPTYLLVEAVLVAATWTLMTWPWMAHRRHLATVAAC